eukprot:GHVT01081716.1.p1 GENE.GHVT01081716.1~~GHVT01081716.1.p1  ORF type:complete len:375 (+),score=60.49 GHVT01081716.1:531-1655(+)
MRPSPFDLETLRQAARQHATPFHIYSEKVIVDKCYQLKNAFAWAADFTNYFAVKATPNPYILEIMKAQGFGADCSSEAELLLSEAVGYRGDSIMLTSNNTDAKTYRKAASLGAIINLDDITHIDYLQSALGGSLPEFLSFRYNPGPEREGNVIIGEPQQAKFGLTKKQLFEAYKICRDRGVVRFGLHTMVVSNTLDSLEVLSTARMIFSLVRSLEETLGIEISMINLGGGLGVAYRPGDKELDLPKLGLDVKNCFEEILGDWLRGRPSHRKVKICFENGRCITGPAGAIVTRVIHQKDTYKQYLGVDASIANLMRPALYNAYHHITVLPDRADAPGELPAQRFIFDQAQNSGETPDNAQFPLKKKGVYDVVRNC